MKDNKNKSLPSLTQTVAAVGLCVCAVFIFTISYTGEAKAKENTPTKVERCLQECEDAGGRYVEVTDKKKTFFECQNATDISKKCTKINM